MILTNTEKLLHIMNQITTDEVIIAYVDWMAS